MGAGRLSIELGLSLRPVTQGGLVGEPVELAGAPCEVEDLPAILLFPAAAAAVSARLPRRPASHGDTLGDTFLATKGTKRVSRPVCKSHDLQLRHTGSGPRGRRFKSCRP